MIRWVLAILILVLALGTCLWPDEEEEAALAPTTTLGTENPQHYYVETIAPTTLKRASRSRTTTPRARTAPRPQVAASGDLLDRLAGCESGRNPRAVGGGGRYWGAFQFLLSTWRSLGGTGNPIDHSYEYQKSIAAKIPVSAWGRQFPVCARRLGVA